MYKKGMTISEVLADALARTDLTQDDAARLLGVKQPTVQRWVTGKDTPSDRYVSAIVKMTGISERRILDAIHAQKLKARSLPSRVAALETEVRQMRSEMSEVLALLREPR